MFSDKTERERENVAHIHLIFPRGHTSESYKTHLKAYINEKYVILAHKNNFLGNRNVFLFLVELGGMLQIVSIIEKHIRVIIKGE